MRHFGPLLLCLTAALPATAGDKAAPLTAKEVAEGWILLFDGATDFGWRVDGQASGTDGVLKLGGGKETTAAPTTEFGNAFTVLEYQGEGELRLLREGKIVREEALSSPDRPKSLGFRTLGGRTKFEVAVPAGKTLAVKTFKLKPIEAVSLFNGKDLDGWTVLPGYKSEYTVTKEGWLNVKDGRGDIQTKKTFKDFVLQFDCISNGKDLNSGIFFRCLPGEYQQGYEAQIRNEFTPGETREYAVEEYDPKTHEKTGTRKVASTAVDYGTGAIYRRVPARKGVAEDGEWFTMTVVADGNHFATWVNGVQVVDWDDNRPRDANARKGCCLNPGAISIQGHDPTTDLSFRNIRVTEIGAVD